MIMGRVLRLGKNVPSCPDPGVFAGPGFGCVRQRIATHRTGNHSDVMSARQASRIGCPPGHGGLCPACTALAHRTRCRRSAGRGRRAAIARDRFPAAQETHEQAGPAAARRDAMDGSPEWSHLNDGRVVSRSVSWFDRTGLSLGGGKMRTRISPIFESCLPPDNVSLRIATGNSGPSQGMAWCGPR